MGFVLDFYIHGFNVFLFINDYLMWFLSIESNFVISYWQLLELVWMFAQMSFITIYFLNWDLTPYTRSKWNITNGRLIWGDFWNPWLYKVHLCALWQWATSIMIEGGNETLKRGMVVGRHKWALWQWGTSILIEGGNETLKMGIVVGTCINTKYCTVYDIGQILNPKQHVRIGFELKLNPMCEWHLEYHMCIWGMGCKVQRFQFHS